MPLVPIPTVGNPAWMPDAWTPWMQLDALKPMPHRRDWGVYAISIKSKPPESSTPANAIDSDIIDIGGAGLMGKGTGTLGDRVWAFRHIQRGKKASHGPGWTCRNLYSHVPLEHYYVAFYVVWEHDAERSMALAMLRERAFIYNWIVQHGTKPPCNRE